MDTTLDTVTAQPSHGKWWGLLLGSVTLLILCFGALMDSQVLRDVKIAAGCGAALSVGLMILARLRLPSAHSHRWAVERVRTAPDLLLHNAHPKITFAMACAGAGLVATNVVTIVVRMNLDSEHRPDGLLRACASPAVILVGMQLIMWAWMRPWDTTVKRLVDS